MARRSFNTETGWYHEARQAFVPEKQRGWRLLCFKIAEHAFQLRYQSRASLRRISTHAPQSPPTLRPC